MPTVRIGDDRINVHAGSRWVQKLSVSGDTGPEQTRIQLRLPDSLSSGCFLETPYVTTVDEVPLIGLPAATHARGVFPVCLTTHSKNRPDSLLRNSLHAARKHMPELADTLWLCVIDPAPVQLVWHESPNRLVAGASPRLRLAIDRAAGELPVRLSLITSQNPE